METTGQWPKSKPPGEGSDEGKRPETISLGRNGQMTAT